MDFRVEAANTDVSSGRSALGRFFYTNGNYNDSHTNKGQIMGSFVGREGKAISASTSYWFAPDTVLKFTYRNGKTSADFIPGGGTTHDAQVGFRKDFPRGFSVDCYGGARLWTYPLLAAGQQRNFIGSVELKFRPSRYLPW